MWVQENFSAACPNRGETLKVNTLHFHETFSKNSKFKIKPVIGCPFLEHDSFQVEACLPLKISRKSNFSKNTMEYSFLQRRETTESQGILQDIDTSSVLMKFACSNIFSTMKFTPYGSCGCTSLIRLQEMAAEDLDSGEIAHYESDNLHHEVHVAVHPVVATVI